MPWRAWPLPAVPIDSPRLTAAPPLRYRPAAVSYLGHPFQPKTGHRLTIWQRHAAPVCKHQYPRETSSHQTATDLQATANLELPTKAASRDLDSSWAGRR